MVGDFFAVWVIGYGIVQGITPKITTYFQRTLSSEKALSWWVLLLSTIPFGIATLMDLLPSFFASVLIFGLFFFGIIFAINSSLHSFLIVKFSRQDSISLDV